MKVKGPWQLRHTIAFATIVLVAIIGASVLLAGNASAQASVARQEQLNVHNDYYISSNCTEGYMTYQQAAGATYTPFATATPVPTAACGLNWRPVTSPNAGTGSNYLNGVAAVSSDDVWAVGYYYNGVVDQTLTLHYTEGDWTVVPSPNVGMGHNHLTAVAAISVDDVWAVGYYHTGGVDKTLTLHYTGGQWTVVSSPNVGTGHSRLTAVAAVSTDDVWAVGHYFTGNSGTNDQTLTLHYSGGQWAVVSSPNVGPSPNILTGVAAASADDVWAVGYYHDGHDQTLTLHYTGGQWTVVSSPNVGPSINILSGVAAVSADDVWAVGSYFDTGGNPGERTLTLHYTNGQWGVVSSPNAEAEHSHLSAVSAVSADDVWAVGYSYEFGCMCLDGSDGSPHSYQTLTLHYIDGAWTVVSSPNVGANDNYLTGVAAVSADDVWAVGHYFPAFDPQTLTLHYSDPLCATSTPGTSTATNTAVVPSATSIKTPSPTETAVDPSATPEPSSTPVEPTPCALEYTDVPSTNTFYQFVRCIACMGIVSGYACGGDGEPCDEDNNPYFRPNVSVTRGQIAKIVSNAAGYDEDPGDQVYEDVPLSNTFYQWINRLSMRGHIGGYPCGGEGEPCGANNLPYFRPFADATRAQLAKIVSNAAGLGDTGADQIFTDVAPDNAFYVWIQRLASRGIMGGYTCGGEGEPCDDENRPYFRPYNNVTRGQASKIVAGAFYPNCQTP
ncbi:MAG TPA: S-layer homology domain-containing protein [Chloroflexia bacterium]|nr:S-layer homology domain-containing protein [Chloroflexia bacterium]